MNNESIKILQFDMYFPKCTSLNEVVVFFASNLLESGIEINSYSREKLFDIFRNKLEPLPFSRKERILDSEIFAKRMGEDINKDTFAYKFKAVSLNGSPEGVTLYSKGFEFKSDYTPKEYSAFVRRLFNLVLRFYKFSKYSLNLSFS